MSGEKVGVLNDYTVEMTDLKNRRTGSKYTVAATVQMTLTDDTDDAEVAGQSWPTALTWVTDGNFFGQLEDTLSLIAGRNYTLVITAAEAGMPNGHWTRHMTAEVRSV